MALTKQTESSWLAYEKQMFEQTIICVVFIVKIINKLLKRHRIKTNSKEIHLFSK